MVTVVVIEFSVMRCQPLRRALEDKENNETSYCRYFISRPY
ncbi:TPA: acetyltransferase [Vibrio cholerae]|nr:acetyltransferase [Vibrio cholerae]HBK7236311.1 acetyltransferase [Vibrio cholerae]HBK7239823.1 acetyltransferase [Vibrio cholerae]